MTDWQRVVAFLRAHPGSSRGELQAALGWAVNVTGRISDARAHGIAFDKVRVDGVWRYSVREPRFVPVQGEQVGAW